MYFTKSVSSAVDLEASLRYDREPITGWANRSCHTLTYFLDIWLAGMPFVISDH